MPRLKTLPPMSTSPSRTPPTRCAIDRPALADRAQIEPGAAALETEPAGGGIGGDASPAHHVERRCHRAIARIGRDRRARGAVEAVGLHERQHGRVVEPVRALGGRARAPHHLDEIGRHRRVRLAGAAVDPRQLAVGAVDAHLSVDAVDRPVGVLDRPRGPFVVRVAGHDADPGAEPGAAHLDAGLGPAAQAGEQRGGRAGAGDEPEAREEAPPRQRAARREARFPPSQHTMPRLGVRHRQPSAHGSLRGVNSRFHAARRVSLHK